MFFSKRRFLASSLSPYHLSEVRFFKHFTQKSMYTALEMRYTVRGECQRRSRSIPSLVELFILRSLAALYHKHIENSQ